MYSPNKTGPYPLIDLDRSALAWPSAWNTAGNFDAVDSTYGESRYPQVRSATVRENDDHVNFIADVDMTLTDNMVMCFGVAVNGSFKANTLFTGHANVAMYGGAVVDVFVGRAVASSLTVARNAQENEVADYLSLPLQSAAVATNGLVASWAGGVIGFDSDEDGHGTNPVILGVALQNHTGSALSLRGLCVSLSIEKFENPRQMFDPFR